jgi:hypothetical protein
LSQMDTSRHNASSYSGYRTLDSVRHHQSHFGRIDLPLNNLVILIQLPL